MAETNIKLPIDHHYSFSAIICDTCSFLEFPGCDGHGLYTQSLPGKRAKCRKCLNSTENTIPFKDGCRKCKSSTKIYMWCITLDGVQQALKKYPVSEEEIMHTILYCEHCSSVLFPSSRDTLTISTSNGILSHIDNRHLNVSNYQINMNHVNGCPRKGMAVNSAAVRLSKQELIFLEKGLAECPTMHKISDVFGVPQYKRRQVAPPLKDNPLNQVYLHLFSTIIQHYDYTSELAKHPLLHMERIFMTLQPLSLFNNWSPPRELPEIQIFPKSAFSSKEFGERFMAGRILENGDSYWKSSVLSPTNTPSSTSSPTTNHEQPFIGVELEEEVTLNSIVITWYSPYIATTYSVNVSTNGIDYKTVSIIIDNTLVKRITFPTDTRAKQIKIIMLTSTNAENFYGMQNLQVFMMKKSGLFVATGDTLHDLQQWIYKMSMHPRCFKLQQAAILSLQNLAIASGSLCTLLLLADALLIPPQPISNSKDKILSFYQKPFSPEMKESTTHFLNTIIHHLYSELCKAEATCDVPEKKLMQNVSNRYEVVGLLLLCLGNMSVQEMKKMQKTESRNALRKTECLPLEEPYSIQVSCETFQLCHRLIVYLLELINNHTLKEGIEKFNFSYSPEQMVLRILQIVTMNLRRLVISKVDPSEVGIHSSDLDENSSTKHSKHPHELYPLVCTMENIISRGDNKVGMETQSFFPLSIQAAVAIEVGMEALYPSIQQRTDFLTARMGKGATLEFQFRWPAAEGNQEDPRFERLVLLLQLECQKIQIKYQLFGSLGGCLYLVMKVHQDCDTSSILQDLVANCVISAGFSTWKVVAGVQEISLTLQRHLHWNRAEKLSCDSGLGWLRIYPREVATYENVCEEIQAFVHPQGLETSRIIQQ